MFKKKGTSLNDRQRFSESCGRPRPPTNQPPLITQSIPSLCFCSRVISDKTNIDFSTDRHVSGLGAKVPSSPTPPPPSPQQQPPPPSTAGRLVSVLLMDRSVDWDFTGWTEELELRGGGRGGDLWIGWELNERA